MKKSAITLMALCAASLSGTDQLDYYEHALSLQKSGKGTQALHALLQAISINPRRLEALFALGNDYVHRRHFHDALQYYQRVIHIDPSCVPAYFNLGYSYFELQMYEDAYHYCKLALEYNKAHARAAYYGGQAAEKLGNKEGAEYCYRQALASNSEYTECLQALAHLLRSQERCNEALELYETLVALKPGDVPAHCDAAYTANMIGQTEQALRHYTFLTSHNPHDILSLYNTGYTLKLTGRIDEALECYARVLTLHPHYEPAEFATALSYLAKGDFAQGWHWYEYYLRREGYNADKLRDYLASNNVHGKRILLVHQGGLGDTLQFIRFAKPLHQAGAYIMVSVPNSLHHLLELCPYIDELIKPGTPHPSYDDRATIMGLPAVVNATEADMATQVPYLYADEDLVEFWNGRLAHDTNFKIGICWQADVKNDTNRFPVARRGIALELFAQLAHIPNISFYSLQACDGLEQLDSLPADFVVHSFDGDFDNAHGRFMDTAAVIKNMNLIITVDTAIAHLAGGLGIPVWLLLPYSTDWRWIVGRTDSPWYPTMRIFKQHAPFAWQEVVDLISLELTALLDT